MPAGWIAGASLVGGLLGAGASESAADTQAASAANAQNISEREFNTITGQESPFIQSGYGSLSQLNYLLGNGQPGTAATPGVGGGSQGTAPTASSSSAGGYGSLVSPFTTQNFQQLSPAYNFQLGQGQQNVLNGDAAGQGALSGSAQKDLINYNQGLANTSFNNAFNQYQTQQGNIFSRLSGIAQLGQAAATNTGQQGTALAGQAGNAALAQGAYSAAGTVGAANALSGSLSSAAPWLAYGGGVDPATNADASAYNAAGAPSMSNSNFTDSDGYSYTFSDARLKVDLERIGTMPSGIPIYKYRYADDNVTRLGVLAQDVEDVFPEAVIENADGFKMVCYERVN